MADPSAISFDQATRVFTVLTSDRATADVYTVTVQALTRSGTNTGQGFSFTVTIRDPCLDASFTFQTGVLPDPYQYVVTQPADTQTVNVASIVSSETFVTCPALEFDLKKQNLVDPVEPSIFNFDPITGTITTQTNLQTDINVYPMTLRVKYVGADFVLAAQQYDFNIEIFLSLFKRQTVFCHGLKSNHGVLS